VNASQECLLFCDRSDVGLQRVAANPQHGLLTTLHETRTNLQFYHVSNTEVIVLFPSELIYQKINDIGKVR